MFYDNGIMYLGDIFSTNGQILFYEEFMLKYNFQTNFLEVCRVLLLV